MQQHEWTTVDDSDEGPGFLLAATVAVIALLLGAGAFAAYEIEVPVFIEVPGSIVNTAAAGGDLTIAAIVPEARVAGLTAGVAAHVAFSGHSDHSYSKGHGRLATLSDDVEGGGVRALVTVKYAPRGIRVRRGMSVGVRLILGNERLAQRLARRLFGVEVQ